ncbi:uncharacterized protein PV07_04047 [Cladophialophora immunda]|uniref:CENP-V/GFA domain-containing protein n=1 Tax=Cladophialophora immunda TaxID=569365 RepID=A0A0D2CRF4_9EURO|nr:uncharacterized protein PV07_04047 [Cladophialophora immunda]KIW32510.1 hypothetical protein PV07_04047 [Cladophialophora immunda]
MSGLEVIGAISGVISIIDASVKVYDGVQKDIKLSDTFHAVGRRLPIIRNTLETCKSHLQPIQDSLPADVREALEKTLEGCDEKARKLREIFEKVLPGGNDGWEKRYIKVIKRLGQGNKVEELMVSITEDVQLVVNHHAVKSAKPEQMAELEKIVQEMKLVQSSVPDEAGSGMTFNSQGGAQMNNTGGGQQINNNGPVTTQNIDIVFRQKADLSFRQPVSLCLGQAPHIDKELFIGRESEIAKMREILRPGDSSPEQRRLVVGGTGGMGKTQLAIAFAKRHQQEYDSIFWLNAASEATLKDSFRLVAAAIFDVRDTEGLQDDQSLIQIQRWLSDKKNTRWLLIFDNYDEPGQYHIEQYYPYVSHGAIIVTTRRPDLVAGSELRLQPLRRVEEGVEILESRSQRKDASSDSHARRLVERLAGLPLALATAGAYLRYSTFTFERYLEEYEQHWNIDPQRPLLLQEYQERTLYTTWDLSYSRLQREDADAARWLGLLAYFSNRRFWYELFRAGLSNESPPWLRGVISSDVEFESTMRKLTNYCFLEVQTSVASWSMHTCVHDWTLATLNEVVDETQYWYAFDCVGASVEQEDFDSLGHFHLADLTTHALRLGYIHDRRGDVMEDLADDRLSRAFLIAELLTKQVQLKAGEEIYERALQGYEKTLGPEHTSTLDIVHNLGLLYSNQGKLKEAEEMYERALQGCEKALGPEHTPTKGGDGVLSTSTSAHHTSNPAPASDPVDSPMAENMSVPTGEKKTFKGSCHCGFIKYEAALALTDPPTAGRCNCTICVKQGFTGIRLPREDFTLLSPASLSEARDYQFRSPDIHKYFCGTCGIHVCGEGKFEFPPGSGTMHEFFSINAVTLDQPQDGLDLSQFKMRYVDGRNDNWGAGVKDVPWPGGAV